MPASEWRGYDLPFPLDRRWPSVPHAVEYGRSLVQWLHGVLHHTLARWPEVLDHVFLQALKRQSHQGACLAKVEPRAPRHERRRVAVADVAEKIRFHMSFREKLLLAGLTFASRKELLIELCVIKA